MKPILKSSFISLLLLATAALIYSNSTTAQGTSPPSLQTKTVISVVNNQKSISDFAQLIKVSGFNRVLAGKGPFTVVAPTNNALESNEKNLDKLEKSAKKARKLVSGYLYKGNIPAKEIESKLGVNIKKQDASAANGVVYVVDSLLKKNASGR
ncbi:MAG TPA: fasciclin domain-containing protein [Balneolales bacterium]|nr:fasciclin domain-containing protein [Balneolales bacterium]